MLRATMSTRPASAAANPQPLYYKEIFSVSGVNAAQNVSITVPNATLAKIFAKKGAPLTSPA